MWEYKEIEGWYDSDTDGAGGYWHGMDMADLNEAGKDGWELVHMERKGDEIVYAFLKRHLLDEEGVRGITESSPHGNVATEQASALRVQRYVEATRQIEEV